MSLAGLIRRRIAAEGPMPLSDYMALCLGHPRHGYYMTRDPLGRAGDFTTAPEISQMFGELLGLALARAWIDQDRPDPFCLAELGPGRGTLMADALRATVRVPGFHAASRLALVETSPALRARQAETLVAHAPSWLASTADLPDLPLFLLANEFFDALPIRQFVRSGGGWCERMVGLKDGRLTPGLSPPLPLDLPPAPEGTVRELRPASEAIAAEIGGRLARRGGLALIVDYGEWEGEGDTFQAVSAHRYADPFAAPGEADLTAQVAFAPLARAAENAGARVAGYATQGDFLSRLGIEARAEALARARPDRAEDIALQLTRLTGADQMGRLFKVLALTAPGAPAPPGFEAEP
ncbi:MAG TPA: SAM-dependent methyltransferase [Paracoccaceae bacterium]|nr:SAM-dependent methyltransferase [Paracoccaceae bacterium]